MELNSPFFRACQVCSQLHLDVQPEHLALLKPEQITDFLSALQDHAKLQFIELALEKCDIFLYGDPSEGRIFLKSCTPGHPCFQKVQCEDFPEQKRLEFSFTGAIDSTYDFRNAASSAILSKIKPTYRLCVKHDPERGVIIEMVRPGGSDDEGLFGDLRRTVTEIIRRAAPGQFMRIPSVFVELNVETPKTSAPKQQQEKEKLRPPDYIREIESKDFPNFDEVVGHPSVIEELKTAALIFAHPDRAKVHGIEHQHLILDGPPGGGKTMMATALAEAVQRLGKPIRLFVVNVNSIGNMYQGGTERRMNEGLAFLDAMKPYVALMEELDGGFKDRDSFKFSNGVDEQKTNIVLGWLDGIEKRAGTDALLIGTTNRGEVVDKALRRAGRFRICQVPKLTPAQISELSLRHFRALPNTITTKMNDVALQGLLLRHAAGWSGADVKEFFHVIRRLSFNSELRGEQMPFVLTPEIFLQCMTRYEADRLLKPRGE